MRLSRIVPALAAAWVLTGEPRYSEHAARHLRAWFVDPDTRMAPHLRYAQAIHGVSSGRGTGIIDTIHLVEVARALESMKKAPGLSKAEQDGVLGWFAEYLRWMTTDPNGIEEREAKNNHGTCWVLQVAAFARLTGNEELLAFSRSRFKTVLVPNQMGADGSFPLETARTKPYGYSLFNLDAMATAAWILSTPADDLWRFETADGRGLRRAVAWMAPVHPRPEEVALPARRDVRRPVADAAAEPALRRPRLRRAGLPRAVEDAARRLDGGRGPPQLLRPPAAALGAVVIPRSGAVIPRDSDSGRCHSEGLRFRALSFRGTPIGRVPRNPQSQRRRDGGSLGCRRGRTPSG